MISLTRITMAMFLRYMIEMDQRKRRKMPRVYVGLSVFTPDGRWACQFYPGVR